MFLDKKTMLKVELNPGLNLTIFRGTGWKLLMWNPESSGLRNPESKFHWQSRIWNPKPMALNLEFKIAVLDSLTWTYKARSGHIYYWQQNYTATPNFLPVQHFMMDPLCIFVITADRMNVTCFSVSEDTVKPVAYYRSNRSEYGQWEAHRMRRY